MRKRSRFQNKFLRIREELQMLSVMERMLPAGILASAVSPRMRKTTRVLDGIVAVAISGFPSQP